MAIYILLTPPDAGSLPEWNRPVLGYEVVNLFLAFVAVVVALVLLRIALHKTRRALVRGLLRFTICLVAILMFVGLFDIILASNTLLQASFVERYVLWPNGDYSAVENDKYGWLGKKNFEMELDVEPSKRGDVTKELNLTNLPDTGEAPYHIKLRRDAAGFRNPNGVPAQADVLIVGDSFAVELECSAGKLWPAIVREELKRTTYNIACSGWGTYREYLAFMEFGLPKKPRIVLWLFFGGNDLHDVASYEVFRQKQENEGMSWTDYIIEAKKLTPRRFPYGRPFVRLLLHLAKLCNPPPKPEGADYIPIMLEANGVSKPHAFYPQIFKGLSDPLYIIEGWRGWQIASNLLKQAIKEHNNTPRDDAVFYLIYVPPKGGVYLPLIEKQVDRKAFYRWVLPVLPENWCENADAFFEKMNENESNIPRLLRELCEEESARFIDTSDALWESTKKGEFPYWCYDTHLNLKGHQIVAQVVLDRLRRDGLTP